MKWTLLISIFLALLMAVQVHGAPARRRTGPRPVTEAPVVRATAVPNESIVRGPSACPAGEVLAANGKCRKVWYVIENKSVDS